MKIKDEIIGKSRQPLTIKRPDSALLASFQAKWQSFQPISQWLLLLASVLLIFLHAPGLLLHPRFWAEEGQVFFAYAYAHSWYQTLIMPHLGYFSLFDNFASLLATFVDLKTAPLVTTLLAFAVQLIPLALIIWSKAEIWQSFWRKCAGLLIVLFVPVTDELWLNTVNSQFYFALVTLLILFEATDGASKQRLWCYRLLLALSGLTGVVSCFLAPLYLVRAALTRRREPLIQAAILVVCCVVQLVFVYVSVKLGQVSGNRFSQLDISVLMPVVWSKDVILPILGTSGSDDFGYSFLKIRDAGPYELHVLGYITTVLVILYFYYLAKAVEPVKRWYLLGAFILLVGLSFASSFSNVDDKFLFVRAIDAHRYFYVPNVIVLILILANLNFSRATLLTPRTLICALLLALALYNGLAHWQSSYVYSDSLPRWSDEVSKWQHEPSYQPQIWPAGWSVDLSPKNKP